MVTIEIGLDDYDKIGSNYISGKIGNMIANKEMDAANKNIRLVFRCGQDYRWMKENGGPNLIVTPDFMPFVLVSDILDLFYRGFHILVEQKSVYPASQNSR